MVSKAPETQKHPGPKAEVLLWFVEMGGIEPPSDVVLSGLLRAQFTSDFLGPSHHVNKWLIRAQPSKSPKHSNGKSTQQWPSK